MLKWHLGQLALIDQIDESVDHFQIPASFPDVQKIADIKVIGQVKCDYQAVQFKLKITATAVMRCALTLKPVTVPVDFNMELLFGDFKDADYALEDPLDLEPIILGNILTELPYRAVSDEADSSLFEAPKPTGHPAFEALSDLIDEKEEGLRGSSIQKNR